MKINALKKLIGGCVLAMIGMSTFASATIEGFWRSVDDRTGELLSIVEIRKDPRGLYTGKIVHRFSNQGGVVLTHCAKCPAPYTNKPIVGLDILLDFDEEKNKAGHYTGRVLEAKSGNIYQGKARITADGSQLHMRGYMGVSMLGRTQVWLRANGPNP